MPITSNVVAVRATQLTGSCHEHWMLGSYLALAKLRNFRGHRGQPERPSGSDMGTTTMPLRGRSGCSCERSVGDHEEPIPGFEAAFGSALIIACEKGDIEVRFSLSSSIEGLENEESGDITVIEPFRTTPPSAT